MTEQPPPPAAISAAFPAPPPFYKSFTSQNLARLRDLQTSGSPLPNLPPELRHLLPPAPPSETTYRSFGESHSISPPTTSISTSTSSGPDPTRLHTLIRTILLEYLSFTHILATEPSAYGPKWDQLRDLFVEAHGVVNEYRPHQARESLIRMMEAQIARCKGETEAVREVGGKARDVLAALKDLGERDVGLGVMGVKAEEEEEGQGGTGKQGGEVRRRLELKRVWQVVEEEVGEF